MSRDPGPPPPGLGNAAWTAHAAACIEGEAGYLDPASGLFSPTSTYLGARGECCGAGCRHCPYPPAEQARAGRPPKPAFPWTPSPA
ncbi:MAG: hypothetical protein JKY65_33015 [Planctomycetes bacterium]|nr:hypothetical protein [Planctomycetota bacterium]